MVVDMSAALLNGLLDYGLIFGHFGLPAPGDRRGRLGHRDVALVSRGRLWRAG